MQTIPQTRVLNGAVEPLRRPELALWTAIMLALCVSALIGHGRQSHSQELRTYASEATTRTLTDRSNWQLDVNAASARELEMLPGIGVRRAQAIVQERQKRGGFSSVWELCEVPGLTRTLVQRLEPLIQVKSPTPPAR